MLRHISVTKRGHGANQGQRSPLFSGAPSAVQRIQKTARNKFSRFFQSGWRDLNPRPLDPQSSALPSCATTRFVIHDIVFKVSPEHSNNYTGLSTPTQARIPIFRKNLKNLSRADFLHRIQHVGAKPSKGPRLTRGSSLAGGQAQHHGIGQTHPATSGGRPYPS